MGEKRYNTSKHFHALLAMHEHENAHTLDQYLREEANNEEASAMMCDSPQHNHLIITDRCVDDDFVLGDKIGEGQYAEVFRAERDGREYAVKLINKGASGMMNGIEKEI